MVAAAGPAAAFLLEATAYRLSHLFLSLLASFSSEGYAIVPTILIPYVGVQSHISRSTSPI